MPTLGITPEVMPEHASYLDAWPEGTQGGQESDLHRRQPREPGRRIPPQPATEPMPEEKTRPSERRNQRQHNSTLSGKGAVLLWDNGPGILPRVVPRVLRPGVRLECRLISQGQAPVWRTVRIIRAKRHGLRGHFDEPTRLVKAASFFGEGMHQHGNGAGNLGYNTRLELPSTAELERASGHRQPH